VIAIVVSHADEASEHIGEHLADLRDWEHRVDDTRRPAVGGGEYALTGEFVVRTVEDLHLDVENAAEAFDADPDLLVFPSRHSGETGPLLTAHFTGNFGPAEYGGTDGELATAAPNALSAVVSAFETHAPDGYDVGVECTHHGPSRVGCPSLFVEVGSAEPQWRDASAARAAALSVLALEGVEPHRERQVVGFGGGHYVPRFLRILRETPWAVGHVAADWTIEAMGNPREHREVVRQAFECSRADRAVIDGDHPRLRKTIADLGYEVVGETWLRAVGDRPIAVVEAIEDRLGPVAEGVRFGDRESDPDEFRVVELPRELVSEAEGIDPEATRAAVAAGAVAFEARENGNRVEEQAAIPDENAYDAIVDGLVAVLERSYDRVERGDDAVVAEETAFDPELAREAGVPEGPAFGKLSNGRSVTVDGERIDPDAVHRRRTRQFRI
jgi:D-aminoacyl-tRNA deacylase